jgi:uncharacterized protein YraI
MRQKSRERVSPSGVPDEEEDRIMKRTGILIAAAMLLLPTAALAAPGLVTTNVSLRAGPGEGFPTVDRIPGGSHVNIHGCLKGDAWCDVSWSDTRGWVSSDELQWLYRNNYVYLSDYYNDIDVPVVPFVLGSYWSSYYSGRPFFHRRAHFDSYWRSHQSVAFRTPDRILRARAGHGNAAIEERGRNANTRVIDEHNRGANARTAIEERNRAGIAREQGRNAVRGAEAARVRGAEAARIRGAEQARVRGAEQARIRGAEQGRIRGAEQARVRGAEQGRMHAAAPAARPAPAARIAQPNVSHGAPMNARAQMPAPRAAAPAMPRAAAPAAAHVGGGAAPHAGGAPGGGGPGPGRHH